MSPCTGSKANTNDERIASWGGCQCWTGDHGIFETPFATHCCSQRLNQSAMTHPSKRIGTSWAVSHTGYNSESILGRNDSLLGCLHLALAYRFNFVWRQHENGSPCTGSKVPPVYVCRLVHENFHSTLEMGGTVSYTKFPFQKNRNYHISWHLWYQSRVTNQDGISLHLESSIDLSHKSQNASVPYPTLQRFVTEMCTCVHISVTNGALWDICLMHSWICEMDLLGFVGNPF